MLEQYDYITETTKDFTGPWYLYLDELVGFFKLFKVGDIANSSKEEKPQVPYKNFI